jgi:hypothetical protein
VGEECAREAWTKDHVLPQELNEGVSESRVSGNAPPRLAANGLPQHGPSGDSRASRDDRDGSQDTIDV